MGDRRLNEYTADLERHRSYLRVIAHLQLSSTIRARIDPSDLVQQTLLRAHQAIEGFRGRTSEEMTAWLRQILARTLADTVRDQRRARRDVAMERSIARTVEESSVRLDTWLVAEQSTPSQGALRNEQSLLLVKALAELPEAQREALLLKHCQGWSLAEIGERMDRSPAAVASLLQRGLKQLREYLLTVEG
jgi:RNA polymerase sigma-70 factor, ECF subfamily